LHNRASIPLPDLRGVLENQIDDNRPYRTLDRLLPHKEQLEVHLKNRMGELSCSISNTTC
jgi:hypothetical protein